MGCSSERAQGLNGGVLCAVLCCAWTAGQRQREAFFASAKSANIVDLFLPQSMLLSCPTLKIV